MAFNSWQFLVFFVVVFAVYFLLPKKVRHYFLLAASYFFYGFWNWRLIFLMLATTLVSYLSGFFIEKYREKKALRITLLVLTLLVSLGALFFFKYFNFVANSVVSLVNAFGGKATFNPLDIILPVGISFYTFQTLSYVIDVFEGKTPAEKNPVYYALYVSFFPQLVAGPIERPENLIPQFKEKQGIQRDNLVAGMKFMLQGFAKKILVADVIATFVNAVYNHLEGTNGFLVALGTIGFALQIYGDFSGYSDIAVGAAKMFNINLSKNFDRPYRATSIKDFWRRWHITLSTWFRDYLYFPMGGSRVPWWRWAINVTVVFFLSGLWHGAALTFIIFGLMHAAYQIIGRATLPLRDKLWQKLKVDPNGKLVQVLRVVGTFVLVCLAWIPFRANSIQDLGTLYRNLFTNWNVDWANLWGQLGLSNQGIVMVAIAVIAYFFVDYIATLPFKHYLAKDTVYLVVAGLVIVAFFYLKYSAFDSTFIYFQF